MTPQQIDAYMARETEKILAKWQREEEREREREEQKRLEREPWRLSERSEP